MLGRGLLDNREEPGDRKHYVSEHHNHDVTLSFTVADRDMLRDCSQGIAKILSVLEDLERRVKEVETWKIKVMALIGGLGAVLGFGVSILFQK